MNVYRSGRYYVAEERGSCGSEGVPYGTAGPAALVLDGLYDGGHGADQLPESMDCLGFAGDLDVGV